ncbi:hypothetical protein J2D73_16255 [Acetobacter sacchari]|uniref:Uncharacterized protein n=1 Tax=Acetobacter sacchari TaxID=2661687 RepID=A0ABS3LZJ8_9PROT|nr:hypothetical protein [Acetobacter sacchari]MBO1361341.1 hypothetical protein [Acetobacter sacchari]
MTIDFTAALTGYVAGNLPSVWHAVPNGVKVRLEQGFDRLTGKVTRRWDRENKSRDADVDDGIKRAGNKSDAQKEVLKLLEPVWKIGLM